MCITKIERNERGQCVQGNLYESRDLTKHSGYENLSSWNASVCAFGNLNETNELVKFNRLFRCNKSDIIDVALAFHINDVVSGSHKMFEN